MKEELIFHSFFKAYYDERKDYYLKIYDVPNMLSEANYYNQVLKPTNISLSEFDSIEARIKFSLPLVYKKFFISAFSVERYFELPALSLAIPWIEDPFRELLDLIFEQRLSSRLIKNKLVPIGVFHSNFYVCLDVRGANEDIDSPIVFIDIDSSIVEQNLIVNEFLFLSFISFIEHCTNSILSGEYGFPELSNWIQIETTYDE